MNKLMIYKDGSMEFDEHRIENGKYFIEQDGNTLIIRGNLIKFGFTFDSEYDKNFLDKVRPEYIKKSWFFKKDYVIGWFAYKETEPIRF